jgi:hypothetical protein
MPAMNRADRRANAARRCPCGSGKKYRNCHDVIGQETIALMRRQAEAVAAKLPRASWPNYNPKRVA